MTQGRVGRLAVVHVSLKKTGTTTLQVWLAQQRVVLRAVGVMVPQSPAMPKDRRGGTLM